jgi:DNA helicase II / ATP-dependent DNA helicase PcrA
VTAAPRVPTRKQEHLAGLGLTDILVLAPAGCGKTESLAMRATAVCTRGDVRPPRKVLAVTFSNKAKDNLAARMRSFMGSSWRERVTVTNFHGLAGRLVRAHGDQVGLQRDVIFPEKAWLARTKTELGISWANSDPFDQALRQAKRDAVGDDVVMNRLLASGHAAAIAFEERLHEESRLDHDDLLRHAARLLAIPDVRSLYQAHFGLVMVDEVQDLTTMQLSIVEAVGVDRITYAGDPAQGIYSFAGAEPNAVFAAIRGRQPEIIEFNESYRSSPAVLAAVNVLAAELGTTQLRCADPDRWPDDGQVVIVKRNSPEEEASALTAIVQALVDRYANASIAIVVRRQTRMQVLKAALETAGQTFEDWSVPTHVPKVVELLKRFVQEAVSSENDTPGQLAALEYACRSQLEESDAAGLDEVSAACEDLRVLTTGGMSLEEAVATCRKAPSTDKPVTPGVHLLNGHLGKGQEFDWVVVLGLEDGQIPDFRASTQDEIQEELRVLHVMVSRARHGLVLTRSATTNTRYGPKAAADSPWLKCLEKVATRSL